MGAASRNKSPKSILVLVLLMMVSLFVLQYLQQKPSSFLWIIAQIVMSTTVIGLFGLFLWIFRDLNVFVGWNKFTLVRLFVVAFSYVIFFTLVNRGFSFLFNGLINPNVISLTPEFLNIVLPTLSGLVIAAYRLTRIFRSRVLDVFREITRDIVVFSLLMFWLGSIVLIVGLNLSTDTSFLSIENVNFLGIIVALVCLGLEGCLLWVRKDLQRVGRGSEIEHLLHSILSIVTPPPAKRESLDDFLPAQSPKYKERTIHAFDKISEILNERFSLKYRGRTLKASEVLKVTGVCCILVIALAFFFFPYKSYTALVPAYSVEVSWVSKNDLPHTVTIITSDGMKDLSADRFFALPIVSVQYQNGSFETPLSDRLLTANSSKFLVLESDNYLLIRLTKIAVETELRDYSFRQTHYDHTDDNSFHYIGFNREAEIFYCMNKFGYNHIVTFSAVSGGEIVEAQKLILGNDTNGQTVLIYIFQRIDIFITEDFTQLTSLDSRFMNQTIFLIDQTKVNTNCLSQLTEPTCPFRMLVKDS